MTANQRPSLKDAMDAVTNGTDEATRIKVCRAVLREAGKKCMEIGGGALTEGIEEIEFGDNLHRALLEYLKAKRDRAHGATYVGITGPMDLAIESAAQTIAAAPAVAAPNPGASES